MLKPEELNQINNQAYAQLAENFDKTTARSPVVDSYLKEMLEGATKNDLVLDIGCGGGYYTNFLNQSAKAVGVDVSPEIINAARDSYPGCDFRIGDMRKLDFTNKSIYGIAMIAPLLHIPKLEAPQVLQELRKVLRDQGKAVFLMKMPDINFSGDGVETRVRSGIEVTRYFARYSEEEWETMLRSVNFKVLKHQIIHLVLDDPEPWLVYLTEVKDG